MEFGAADLAAVGDLDFGDARGVDREDALDALAVGDFADGEGGVDGRSVACDDEAGEDLDTFLATFDNAAMDLDGVSDVEISDVWLELLLLDFLNDGGHDLEVVGLKIGWIQLGRNSRGEMAS